MKKVIETVQYENKKLEAKIKTTKSAFKCDECDHQATSTKDLTTHLKRLDNYGNLAHCKFEKSSHQSSSMSYV